MAFASHQRAHFDYEILEKYEAGLSLLGTEAKSLRKGQGRLEGAHITVRGGEAFLLNAEIPAHQSANAPTYDPKRNRKLLLGKKEIAELANYESQKGLAIIPLAIFAKGPHLKLSIGVGRGKKKFDKRESIKKREATRDIARDIKGER